MKRNFKKLALATVLSTMTISASLMATQAHAGWFDKPEPTFAKTQYPIVMVGGAFAFDSAIGIDYWYGITDALREQGAEVYVTNLSSSALNEVRGEELVYDIEQILALTGADKVNLIAHSQGALASRFAANDARVSEYIASVSTSHGMNKGTHFSEGFRGAIEEGSTIETLGVSLINVVFNTLELLSADEDAADGDYDSPARGKQDLLRLAQATNREQVALYAAEFTDMAVMPTQDCMTLNNGEQGEVDPAYYGQTESNGIKYFSWGGNQYSTNVFDPLDSMLVPIFGLFVPEYKEADGFQWDGLVPVCGQAMGKVVKLDYNANHFDAINQLMGLGSWKLNIPAIYTKHANMLAQQGL
ncbi:MAG: triacylglycerol lipase [Moritella dasanensis]|jgi:triacylglycerol lipase